MKDKVHLKIGDVLEFSRAEERDAPIETVARWYMGKDQWIEVKWDATENALSVRCHHGPITIRPQVANSVCITAPGWDWREGQ